MRNDKEEGLIKSILTGRDTTKRFKYKTLSDKEIIDFLRAIGAQVDLINRFLNLN